MNGVGRLIVAVIGVAILTSGLTGAHRVGPLQDGFKGLPKNYCENPVYWWDEPMSGFGFRSRAIYNYDPTSSGNPTRDYYDLSEVSTHDYGPPTAGVFSFTGFGLLQDGNLNDDCDGDGRPADFDRHTEFASGGAILLARSDPVTLVDVIGTFTSDGTETCWGRTADHVDAIEDDPGTVFDESVPISVYVNDLVWGAAIAFAVTSDWNRAGIPNADGEFCGDLVLEPCDANDPSDIDQVTCNSRDRATTRAPDYSGITQENVATVGFMAGADGSYLVFVGSLNSLATMGHVGTQPDYDKKKPNLPGGVLLPNVVVALVVQDGLRPVPRILGVGPHCATSVSFPATSNQASVTCAWDFKTSCSGSVVAHNAAGPGAVSGQIRCGPGGVAVADATASPGAVKQDSGAALGVFKAWTCEVAFEVVDATPTPGTVACLAPVRAFG